MDCLEECLSSICGLSAALDSQLSTSPCPPATTDNAKVHSSVKTWNMGLMHDADTRSARPVFPRVAVGIKPTLYLLERGRKGHGHIATKAFPSSEAFAKDMLGDTS